MLYLYIIQSHHSNQKHLAVKRKENKMKLKVTTQEMFKWLLDNWDHKCFKRWSDFSICDRIDTMNMEDMITDSIYEDMADLVIENRGIAISKFGASDTSSYWWASADQDSRKKFVKYLSNL